MERNTFENDTGKIVRVLLVDDNDYKFFHTFFKEKNP